MSLRDQFKMAKQQPEYSKLMGALIGTLLCLPMAVLSGFSPLTGIISGIIGGSLVAAYNTKFVRHMPEVEEPSIMPG